MTEEIKKLDADYEERLIDKAVEVMFERLEKNLSSQFKVLGYIRTLIVWIFAIVGCAWLAFKNRAYLTF